MTREEAINAIKAWDFLNNDEKEVIKTLIPELAESDDERIKKEFCNDIWTFIPNEKAHKYIAWLEKQESVEEIVERCKKSWYNEGKIQGQIEGLTNEEKYQQGWRDALENQGVYEPIEMVELKFHDGDWTVSNLDKKVRKISEVHFDKYNSYYVVDGKSVNLEEYDRLHHLWSIKDAKPGDILCTYECDEPKIVFILKGIPKKGYALSYYCYYNIMYPSFKTDKESGCIASDNIKPATKEQRDLLFQKMKEAGYEWDAEKKELKKIEQEPYPETLDKAIDLYYYTYGNGKGGFDHLSLEKFKGIVKMFVDDYGMQNHAWSEEDDAIRNDLINYFRGSALETPEKEVIDFLKSLKERVLPQPKQEWSEDDEKGLSDALWAVEQARTIAKDENDMGNIWYAENWLKSLKERIGE